MPKFIIYVVVLLLALIVNQHNKNNHHVTVIGFQSIQYDRTTTYHGKYVFRKRKTCIVSRMGDMNGVDDDHYHHDYMYPIDDTNNMEHMDIVRPQSSLTVTSTTISRRKMIRNQLIGIGSLITSIVLPIDISLRAMELTSISSSSSSMLISNTNNNDDQNSNIIMNQLLDQLRKIPTFCIVNNSTGASYMIYKQDMNMGIGYAFLTYIGAMTVLQDARQNAIDKGATMETSIWTNATITTIPLDVAIRLALKKRSRMSSKNQTLDTLVMIIPGSNERFDGMAIDKNRYQNQGKVPLFYIKENNNDNNQNDKIRLYFNRQDLIADYTKDQKQQQQPSQSQISNEQDVPPIDAIELMGIFESIVLGRNIQSGKISNIQSSTFEFIPNQENIAIAQEMKQRGLVAPYNPNKMIL